MQYPVPSTISPHHERRQQRRLRQRLLVADRNNGEIASSSSAQHVNLWRTKDGYFPAQTIPSTPR